MSFFMPTCKEVALLTAKREAEGLTMAETLRLQYHMAICTMCKRLDHQFGVLRKGARVSSTTVREISPECQERITKALAQEEHFPHA